MLMLLALTGVGAATFERALYSLDSEWRFQRFDAEPLARCPDGTWTTRLDDTQTLGLRQGAAITEMLCAEECCADSGCETYQFCNVTACGSGPPSQGSCWLGALTGATTINHSLGWRGQARAAAPAGDDDGSAMPACEAGSWCWSSLDDAGWRSVNVPHDFVVEGNFSLEADEAHGFLPYGVGVYRKRLALSSAVADAVRSGSLVASLEFDGAQTETTVYLDDVYLGAHRSGYTDFRFPLGEEHARAIARPDGALLAVRVDASSPDGWWYDGGGLYRHVRLLLTPAVHLSASGGAYLPTRVTSEIRLEGEASRADAVLEPTVTVSSSRSAVVDFVVEVVLREEATGVVVGRASRAGAVSSKTGSTVVALPVMAIPNATLWGPPVPFSRGSPFLYSAEVVVSREGSRDASNHTIGVRSLEWRADSGLWLNGAPCKILGVANHQDFAGVGVAVPDALQRFRVRKMQQMGANGWRTAHNAPTPALLDATDRAGVLVWDETHRNGAPDEQRRLVARDRNHVSVVIWSICNEKLCDTANTLADGARSAALYHSMDPKGQRAVSANFNDWLGHDYPGDVQGVDYATQTYDQARDNAPEFPYISSETSSAVGDRGEYANDAVAGHVTGYDTEAPSWGQTAQQAWAGVGEPDGQGILTRDFVAGGWTWTGFDYKGEPTPYGWPNVNSHFGILDICGFEKDRFYWYLSNFAAFERGEGVAHVFPHWTWASDSSDSSDAPHLARCRGGLCARAASGETTVAVWAYTNGASAELFVNDRSQGVVRVARGSHAEWRVPYAPGSIRVLARDADNRTIAEDSCETTGPAVALRATFRDDVGRAGLTAGCGDVALVQVEVLDSAGRRVPTSSALVAIAVSGPAAFIGGGNGDPSCHVPDKASERPAFHGLLLGIVQASTHDTTKTGHVTVTVSAPGLSSDELSFTVAQPTRDNRADWWCPLLPQL